jgi:hypothetical protein
MFALRAGGRRDNASIAIHWTRNVGVIMELNQLFVGAWSMPAHDIQNQKRRVA